MWVLLCVRMEVIFRHSVLQNVFPYGHVLGSVTKFVFGIKFKSS